MTTGGGTRVAELATAAERLHRRRLSDVEAHAARLAAVRAAALDAYRAAAVSLAS